MQEVPVDGVGVVTTPFPACLDDTARSVELFRDNDVPVLGAVVNRGGFTCPTCGDDHDLFPGGSPDEVLSSPILAELPFSIRGDPPERRRERVAERFEALDSGETFALVSDRDPTPVREYLAELADRRPAEIEGFEVERRTPDDWALTATRP